MGDSKFFDKETYSKDIWLKSFSPSFETNIKYLLSLNVEEEEVFDPQKIYFGYSPKERIQIHIDNCKKLLEEIKPESPVYKDLISKIVQLKLCLLNVQEKEESQRAKVYYINGHLLKLKNKFFLAEKLCGKCNNSIIPLYHQLLECESCHFICHVKCSSSLQSQCLKSTIQTHPSYILAIKPETGLINQDFKCANCKENIDINKPTLNLNICDYTGLIYCEQCYRKDSAPIPARILHNWDFKPRGVCKKSRHYLHLMKRKPVLSLIDINPSLFENVPALKRLGDLRKNLLYVKVYLTTCKAAIANKMLLKLSHRQHFIENSEMYSIQDLIDVNEEVLIPELALIYNSYLRHIKHSCQTCKSKGFYCELCNLGATLFPFDPDVTVCTKCMAVYHKNCYELANRICPRCRRRLKKKAQTNLES